MKNTFKLLTLLILSSYLFACDDALKTTQKKISDLSAKIQSEVNQCQSTDLFIMQFTASRAKEGILGLLAIIIAGPALITAHNSKVEYYQNKIDKLNYELKIEREVAERLKSRFKKTFVK